MAGDVTCIHVTWRLTAMDVAIRSIDAQIAPGELNDDQRRRAYRTPPAANANYAWVYLSSNLAAIGLTGFVFAKGSMSWNRSVEGLH